MITPILLIVLAMFVGLIIVQVLVEGTSYANGRLMQATWIAFAVIVVITFMSMSIWAPTR